MPTIQQVLNTIKNDFDTAITTATFNGQTYTNGQKAKEALIRSQKIINYLHDFVKQELISAGVISSRIIPSLGQSRPELVLNGFLKSKNQDVCAVPNICLRNRAASNFSTDNKILSVNVRSQLSSMEKNFDTLFERTFAEALNLHLSYPDQVLGELYLIPVYEYDDKAMENNNVRFKRCTNLEKYISMFQKINNRTTIAHDEYKYERACLLIVDFNRTTPKLYSTISDMVTDSIISSTTAVTMNNLSIINFCQNLFDIYISRFGPGLIN